MASLVAENLVTEVLRVHSKRFANGKGGLSYAEISIALGGRLGSHTLVGAVQALLARDMIKFAVVEPWNEKLFYLNKSYSDFPS